METGALERLDTLTFCLVDQERWSVLNLALVRSADDQEKSTFLGVLCIWYCVRGVGRGV
jgi:hypothetical protein